MKPRGFALATVVLMLALIATSVFLVTRAAGTGLDRTDKARDVAAARYAAEAGMTHALWLAQNSACADYALPATAFGTHTYQATFAPTSNSPVVVKAIGTSASGAIAQVSRSAVPVYDASKPQTLTLQFDATTGKDAILDDFYPVRNYGGIGYLSLNSAPGWSQRPVLEFDVSAIPANAKVLSAQLELKQTGVGSAGLAGVHRLTRSWLEGTKKGGGTADGATWQTHDGANAWTQAGGDYDPTLFAQAAISSAGNGQWVSWEVRDLVQGWVSGALANFGMLLAGDGVLSNAGFDSREATDPLNAPKLTVTYVCECGKDCGGGGVPATVLFVVVNPSSLSVPEQDTRSLIESWGYTLNLIAESATQADFDDAVANADVAYVPEDIASGMLGTKLRAANIGVVIEEEKITDEFGLSSGETTFSEAAIEITDNTHYITAPFSLGSVAFVTSAQPVGGRSGTLAPDLTILALRPSSTTSVLDVIETGGALFDAGVAAGRRVKLPWGGNDFDINALTPDGQTIMQRAIEWAAGADLPGCTVTTPLLFVVSDSSSPTVHEIARQSLLESWCYDVTLIDDGSTQLQYDADVAATDVVYVSPEVLASQVGDKLKNVTAGVVNEDPGLHTSLGFSTARYQGSTNAPLKTEASHEITAPFAGGLITLFTSDQPAGAAVGTIPAGLLTIGSWSSGDLAPLGGLLTLESGAAIAGGGTAAGRRVQLPWDGVDGVSVSDITALTADGETILQRSLEWAADSGGGGGGAPPSGISFETFAEAGSNSDNVTLNVTAPAGTVSGDLLIAAVATDGLQVSQITAPAGWTLIDHGDQSAEVTLDVWWKIADGAEPASYEFSWAAAQKSYGLVMRFTGHNATTPISTSASTGGSSNTPLSPAVVSTVADSLILRIGGFDDDDINSGDPGLSGHTPITMGKSGNGNGTVSGGAGYLIQPAAGDSGTSTFWLNATEEYRTVTIAIAPE